MNASYRKASKGDVTCGECCHSGVRKISGRLQCRWWERHYICGRNHTCDMAEKRGDK